MIRAGYNTIRHTPIDDPKVRYGSNSALEALSPQVRLAAVSGTFKLSSHFALVPSAD
jgi:hypothetical protein